MKKILFLLVLINLSIKVYSQSISIDTTQSVKLETLKKVLTKQDSIKKGYKIIPRMSTIHSAMVPGWGQIDNRQYWKLPLVAGAFGTVIFFIVRNNNRYLYYRDRLVETYIPIFPDLNPPNRVTFDIYETANKVSWDQNQITSAVSFYRKNRDFSYLFLLVAWAANIIDANVTAHLKTFDVTDDISLKIQPTFTNPEFGTMPVYGAKLTLAFK
jgi:Family of unknown function (DUF5683)